MITFSGTNILYTPIAPLLNYDSSVGNTIYITTVIINPHKNTPAREIDCGSSIRGHLTLRGDRQSRSPPGFLTNFETAIACHLTIVVSRWNTSALHASVQLSDSLFPSIALLLSSAPPGESCRWVMQNRTEHMTRHANVAKRTSSGLQYAYVDMEAKASEGPSQLHWKDRRKETSHYLGRQTTELTVWKYCTTCTEL